MPAAHELTKTHSSKTNSERLLKTDVACIVTQLSQFLENPDQRNWKADIRVQRYLKINNSNEGKVALITYTDADRGRNLATATPYPPAPVVFKSKYPRTVALISVGVECMTPRIWLWTRAMLEDLGLEQVGATHALEDNQGARTKPVDIKHHFTRRNVTRGVIDVNYIPTKDQFVDMLTKRLGTKRIQYLLYAREVVAKAVQQ
ncbi:polyprotein [Phytophthora megakarya]|uniref:Polyprotein n=1 Tax=Phytophthora megakarya TaxID=4795 RepID=A0A225W4D2_9STRA|nr:polyprotein [Phytophthora megakarya]